MQFRSAVATGQAHKEAKPRHRQELGDGGYCIPQGWGTGGSGDDLKLLLSVPGHQSPVPDRVEALWSRAATIGC